MSTLLVLILALVAAGFALRARSEAQRRTALEDTLERERRASDALGARVAPLLTHELRSQIATILGYQELLADGVLGDIQAEGVEALGRIRRAGRQILALTDGTGRLLAPRRDQPRIDSVDLADALLHATAEAAPLAEAHGVTFEQPVLDAPAIAAETESLRSALELILGAVIRTAVAVRPALTIDHEANHAVLRVHPTGLVPRDGAALDESRPAPTTGAGLRLAMAAALLRPAGGRISLDPNEDGHATLLITLPLAASQTADSVGGRIDGGGVAG
jgi:signal transduction histidine kinase